MSAEAMVIAVVMAVFGIGVAWAAVDGFQKRVKRGRRWSDAVFSGQVVLVIIIVAAIWFGASLVTFEP